MLLSISAWAEPTYDEFGDLIRPNAEKFSGKIDGIQLGNGAVSSTVIIDDTNYHVDNNTLYRDALGRKSRLSYFEEGMTVDYYAIDYLVTNLSVSSDQEEENVEEATKDYSPPAPDQSGIHKEDGIWKN